MNMSPQTLQLMIDGAILVASFAASYFLSVVFVPSMMGPSPYRDKKDR